MDVYSAAMRVPITVKCYEGGRADERPRRVTIRGHEHHIARLLHESVEESLDTKTRVRRYTVLTDEELVLMIKRTSEGNWFLDSELPED